MKKDDWGALLIILLLIGMLCATFFGAILPEAKDKYYKQGQIDAITGTVNYELIEAEDGSRSWEGERP